MKEADLSKKMALLIRTRGGWARKIAGGPSQAGLSDIMACYRGHFISIETKLPGKERTVTVLQRKTLDAVKAAGGIGVVCTTAQQVGRLLDRIDKAYDG